MIKLIFLSNTLKKYIFILCQPDDFMHKIDRIVQDQAGGNRYI
jgi:hypothetical protein